MRRRGAAVLALAIAGCQFTPPESVASLESLPKAPALHGPFDVTITEIGLVKSKQSRWLSARFWGAKVKKLVAEGTIVAPGDPVAWLEDQETSERAETKEVELRAMESSLDKAKEEMDHQGAIAALDAKDKKAAAEMQDGKVAEIQAEVDRLRPMAERGLLSPEDMKVYEQKLAEAAYQRDQAKSAWKRAESESAGNAGVQAATYDETRARYESVHMEVEELRQTIDNLVLKSPVAGAVNYPPVALRFMAKEKRKVQVGDEVNPMRPFIEIADLTALEIRTQVPERRIGDVAIGTKAKVTVDSVDHVVVDGAITRIESLATTRAEAEATSFIAAPETRREKVFELTIAIPGDEQARLKPGMTATVELLVKKLPESTYIPLAAVFEDGRDKVAFVVARGKAVRRVIELGQSRDDAVIVTKGVDAGETVLLADPRGIVSS
ncbi:MAG: HlyD family efflux transporter periplasmic adaptor subunit [Acidobacteriota bacterium]